MRKGSTYFWEQHLRERTVPIVTTSLHFSCGPRAPNQSLWDWCHLLAREQGTSAQMRKGTSQQRVKCDIRRPIVSGMLGDRRALVEVEVFHGSLAPPDLTSLPLPSEFQVVPSRAPCASLFFLLISPFPDRQSRQPPPLRSVVSN